MLDFCTNGIFDYIKYEEFIKTKVLSSGYIQYGPYSINPRGIQSKSDRPICNFLFFVKAIEDEINELEGTKQYLTLVIRHISLDNDKVTYDDSKEYRLSLQESRNITKLYNSIDITCRIFDKKAFQDIFETMIETADRKPKYIINRTGWQENGSYAFANGIIGLTEQYDSICPKDSIIKHKLNIDPYTEITLEQEQKSADLIFENMNHLENKEVFYFLYLYQILSLLSSPLRKMYDSRAPRFIVVLTGNPSAGKTGICKWLISYRTYSPMIDLSSGSTEAGFFNEISESSDCVFLADDFKLNPSHKKQVEDMVEMLTRVGGNNSGKRNARGSFQMNGSILMTAEFLPDLSDSSLNRMLEWNIESQDNNWRYLDAISNDKYSYAAHYLSLIRWIISVNIKPLCANLFSAFERIKNEIKSEYPYCERRIDAYAWLLAAYEEVYCKYLQSIGKSIYDVDLYRKLYTYASKTLKSYQREILEKDVVYKLCSLLLQGSINLHNHDSSMELQSNESGLFDYNFFYLIKDKFDPIVNRIGAIDCTSMVHKLIDAKLLVIDPNRYGCKRITHKGVDYLTYCISKQAAKEYISKIDRLLEKMGGK